MAEGLITLTHEAMHMRGWADEAVAQCYAIQEVAFTVEWLGGSLVEGAAVADYALALHPNTPAFPAEVEPAPLQAGLFGPQL